MTYSLPHTHLNHICTRKQVHSHLNPLMRVHILYSVCIDPHRYIIFVYHKAHNLYLPDQLKYVPEFLLLSTDLTIFQPFQHTPFSCASVI